MDDGIVARTIGGRPGKCRLVYRFDGAQEEEKLEFASISLDLRRCDASNLNHVVARYGRPDCIVASDHVPSDDVIDYWKTILSKNGEIRIGNGRRVSKDHPRSPDDGPRVLIVTPWTPQGLTSMSVHLGRHLEQFGAHVDYHAWRHPNEVVRRFEPPGWLEDSRVICKPFHRLQVLDYLLVIWMEVVESDQVARCKKSGVHTIWIPMWEFVDMPHPTDTWADWDNIVCPTKCCYDLIRQFDKPCCYIPWWSDYTRRLPRTTPDEPTFLHVVRGLYGDGRNTQAVAHGWRDFKKTGGRGKLIIKSMRPLHSFVDETVYSLPECRIIEQTLPMEKMALLYQEADVFLYPTKREGLGLTALEALASGLPVMTTDIPPMNEWVEDECNGWLLHVGTPEHSHGKHVLQYPVDVAAMVDRMRRLTPHQIDQCKKEVHRGFDNRRRAFSDAWFKIVSELKPHSIRRPKKHVVIVANLFGANGGGTLNILRQAEFMRDRGFEVSAVYARAMGDIPEWISAYQTASFSRLGFYEILREMKHIDVLVYESCDMPIMCVGLIDVPTVTYMQFLRGLFQFPDGFADADKHPIPDQMLDIPGILANSRSDALIANSPFTARLCRELLEREPNAIVYPFLEPSFASHSNGNLRSRKRVLSCFSETLRGANEFVGLARSYPELEFMMLSGGNGVYDDQVLAEFDRLANTTRVRTWVNDMSEIYGETRCLFVGAHTTETFGRCAAEARANGIPVIANRVGNLPNIIDDCDAGVLVPRNAGMDEWSEALDIAMELQPQPTGAWNQDHREQFVNVIESVLE